MAAALRIVDEGAGPPVVLLHGFPDRAELWRDVGARLREAGLRTLAVDLPGFGDSPMSPERAGYRADRVAAQILRQLRDMGVDTPVDVVGHDWGAYLGWVMCLGHPDRVRRHAALSVGHPKAFVLAGLEQKRKATYMLTWQVPGVTERRLRRGDFRRLRAFFGGRHPDEEQVVRDLHRPGRLTAGLNWYRENYFRAVTTRWRSCEVPTLGIWSTEDRYLAEDQMVGSARYVTAPWRYARLDGVGHWMPLEAPDRVAELLVPWLTESA